MKQALFTKFEMKLGMGKRFWEDVGGRWRGEERRSEVT